MSESRSYVLRVWQLAEQLAADSRKPLHAFLLLHHVLTHPPPSLRRGNSTAASGGTTSSTATATAVPLHLAAFDAEWKCEELATRVRAAEFLLFPDVQPPVRPAATSAGGADSAPCVTSAPQSLSRAAALESLELAEQILSPVIAASASSSSSISSYAGTSGTSRTLDATMREIALSTSPSAGAAATQSTPSAHAAATASVSSTPFSSLYGGSGGGPAADARGAQMHFFNESAVAAVAWPLSAFVLDWPIRSFPSSTPSTSSPSTSSTFPLVFKAANQTITVALALVVRAHVLQAVVCYRRVQYKRALQCLAEGRKWVQLQFTAAARQRSLRLLWADLRERWSPRTPSALSLLPEHLPCFEACAALLIDREYRACTTMISVEECKVHWMIVQACGTIPAPPLSEFLHTRGGGGNGGGAQAPDLRLHFKRYHESVQQLHHVSRVYMQVLEWTDDEEDEAHKDEDEPLRVRVKQEVVEEDEQRGKLGEDDVSPVSRAQLRHVQSQLSSFCLCALHRCHLSATTTTTKTERNHRRYKVAYDSRLAAEVLGWYHCMSFLFLLYEPSLSALTNSSGGGASTAVRGAEASDNQERNFLSRYVTALLPSTKYSGQPNHAATPAAAAPLESVAVLMRDPVQRARAHFRAYAAVFGARAAAAAAAERERGDEKSGAPAVASMTHEAGLLWSLAELALVDGYPAALRLCSALNETQTRSGAANQEGSVKTEPAARDENGVSGDASAVRKRARPAAICPPPSWHWVVPGVRGVLQLYVGLLTMLMQAAATMHGGTPPLSPSTPPPQPAATRVTTTTTATTSDAATSTPPVPVLQAGLQRAEQVLARLLFALDREMLQLTGNAWGAVNAFAGPQQQQQQQRGDDSDDAQPSCRDSSAAWVRVDQLQCSPPAQLRWLVQLKSAALLAMARHHVTQLSLAHAVHHLRDVQHFTRVFRRQAKFSLLPEMHLLLAAVATCMSLRRFPEDAQDGEQQQRARRTERGLHGQRSASEGEEDEGRDNAQRHAPHARSQHTARDALFAFARGWPLADGAGGVTASALAHSSPFQGTHTTAAAAAVAFHSNEAAVSSLYSITPEEEYTLAQDVGLPYLHLLAAERAACTSLHTPTPLFLLIYLMKAWAVYQLVAAGEELTWAAEAPPVVQSDHAQQQQQQQLSPALQNPLVSPLSPVCPPLPLPTASYATTSLNTTVADQQRRVARLESLTSTPFNTPTLRSRHAMLPAEMQRIQLELPTTTTATTSSPPLLSPERTEGDAETPEGMKQQQQQQQQQAEEGGETRVAAAPVSSAAATKSMTLVLSPLVQPLPPSSHFVVSAAAASAAAAAATSAIPLFPAPHPSSHPRARVAAVPPTVRHRAGDLLQRMLAVLQHHHESYQHYLASLHPNSSSSGAAPASHAAAFNPTTAWTPLNVTLYRLLRGAVTLTEDRDEPGAARELKATTHFAKQHLGVLHPCVADGLALLASAYASLDVDTEEGTSTAGSGGAARTRRVAIQLAMRCSCTALAALPQSDISFASAPSFSATSGSPAVAPHVGVEVQAAEASAPAAAAPAVHESSAGVSSQQQSIAATHARLREWWSTQVLEELCGNSSPQRGAHAMGQLQALFGWLPGVEEDSQ